MRGRNWQSGLVQPLKSDVSTEKGGVPGSPVSAGKKQLMEKRMTSGFLNLPCRVYPRARLCPCGCGLAALGWVWSVLHGVAQALWHHLRGAGGQPRSEQRKTGLNVTLISWC